MPKCVVCMDTCRRTRLTLRLQPRPGTLQYTPRDTCTPVQCCEMSPASCMEGWVGYPRWSVILALPPKIILLHCMHHAQQPFLFLRLLSWAWPKHRSQPACPWGSVTLSALAMAHLLQCTTRGPLGGSQTPNHVSYPTVTTHFHVAKLRPRPRKGPCPHHSATRKPSWTSARSPFRLRMGRQKAHSDCDQYVDWNISSSPVLPYVLDREIHMSQRAIGASESAPWRTLPGGFN